LVLHLLQKARNEQRRCLSPTNQTPLHIPHSFQAPEKIQYEAADHSKQLQNFHTSIIDPELKVASVSQRDNDSDAKTIPIQGISVQIKEKQTAPLQYIPVFASQALPTLPVSHPEIKSKYLEEEEQEYRNKHTLSSGYDSGYSDLCSDEEDGDDVLTVRCSITLKQNRKRSHSLSPPSKNEGSEVTNTSFARKKACMTSSGREKDSGQLSGLVSVFNAGLAMTTRVKDRSDQKSIDSARCCHTRSESCPSLFQLTCQS